MAKSPDSTSSAVALIDDDEQSREMGAQLEEQYDRATSGMREVLLFGAMMMHLRERLAGSKTTAVLEDRAKLPKGRHAAEGGVTGWLEKFAPKVAPSNARRFEAVAFATAKLWDGLPDTLAKKIEFPDLVTKKARDLEKIDRRLPKKQEEVFEFARGHGSQKALLDQFVAKFGQGGNQYDRGEKGKRRTKAQLEAEALAFGRQIWTGLTESLPGYVEQGAFRLLDDSDLDLAIANFSSALSKLQSWRKTPKQEREAPARAALAAAAKQVK